MRHRAENYLLQHVFGLSQGLGQIITLGGAVADIGKSDDVTAILLLLKMNRISVWIVTCHFLILLTQIFELHAEIPKDRKQGSSPDFIAAGGND
jgi:hypothetical protein